MPCTIQTSAIQAELRRLPRVLGRCRGLRSEDGSALVELAVIVGLLGIPLLAGTAEMGLVVYDSIEVASAASAGASYGMQSATFAANTSGIITAAQTEAADFGTSLTVTPTVYYACALAVDGTQYTGANAQANATTGCTGASNHALEFVQVKTSVNVAPGIHLPALPSAFTVVGSSVMEVEQ
jgi:Flp pilus assembly protein TadG